MKNIISRTITRTAAAASASATSSSSTLTKQVGDISSVFPSLSGKKAEPLPARFRDLKRSLVPEDRENAVTNSWNTLLNTLRMEVEEVKVKGNQVSCWNFKFFFFHFPFYYDSVAA
jgi:hypothetical protein